jgi:hypothetical protein
MPSFLGAQRFTITPETPLVFVHLFKCAGTSVHEYLCSVFPPEAVCPARHIHEYETIVPGYLVYSGHMRLRQWDRAPMRPHFVTWLRHPVARVTSAFYFLKVLTDGYVVQARERAWIERVRGSSFRDFVHSDEARSRLVVRNGMSRVFCSDPAAEQWPWWRLAWNANRALKRFAYIGIAERTDECLAHLARRFGLPAPARRFNSNNYIENARNAGVDPAAAEPVTPEIAAAIRRHSRADRLLYRKAVALSARMT